MLLKKKFCLCDISLPYILFVYSVTKQFTAETMHGARDYFKWNQICSSKWHTLRPTEDLNSKHIYMDPFNMLIFLMKNPTWMETFKN